jgi:hypothetical protein
VHLAWRLTNKAWHAKRQRTQAEKTKHQNYSEIAGMLEGLNEEFLNL